ncbi:hypothetical protein R3P38DRAFT_494952 [Favolaschia claudopus]|uniref:F-box domain-containing protein n=1 Tax=Favolaschia claudopus TaxID=2862362 RepID=A0AAW0CK37_9AGAR
MDALPVLPAIQRAPPEILSEIFAWTRIPTFFPETGIWHRTVNQRVLAIAPWRLSHVCQDWRNATHGNAQLWSTIEIDTLIDSYCPMSPNGHYRLAHSIPTLDYPLAAIRAQLLLSANAPLYVLLRLGDLNDASDLAHVFSLLETILDHSNRFRSLTLCLRMKVDADAIRVFSVIKGQLASLDHLHFQCRSNELEEWPAALKDIFLHAPRLQDVYFPGADPLPISLPYPQLTKLTFYTYITSAHLLAPGTLRLAQGLVSLNLGGPDKAFSWSISDVAPVHLPNLSFLGLWDGRLSAFFDTPKLNNLYIRANISAAIPFVQRFGSQLNQLNLRCYYTELSILPRFLRLTPNVSTLDLNFSRFDDPFDQREGGFSPATTALRAMTVSGSAQALCPLVTKLHIGVHSDASSAEWNAVYDMVKSRCDAMPPLRRLSFRSAVPPGNREKLKALRTPGLEIILPIFIEDGW